MPQFRKKPITVQAEQYMGCAPFPAGICLGERNDQRTACCDGPHVHTLEGPLHVSHGDWIITGVKGDRYPCKPDVFEATYEEIGRSFVLPERSARAGVCRKCGCTDDKACPGGCSWVEPDLCSACVP